MTKSPKFLSANYTFMKFIMRCLLHACVKSPKWKIVNRKNWKSLNLPNAKITQPKVPYSGLFSRGKIFTNARCGDISRGKFLRMVNKELISNHTPIYIFSRGKYSRIEVNPRNLWKFSPSKITRYTVCSWPLYPYALVHIHY